MVHASVASVVGRPIVVGPVAEKERVRKKREIGLDFEEVGLVEKMRSWSREKILGRIV